MSTNSPPEGSTSPPAQTTRPQAWSPYLQPGGQWDARFWVRPRPRELNEWIGSRCPVPRQAVQSFQPVNGPACDPRGRWWLCDLVSCRPCALAVAADRLGVCSAFLRTWTTVYVAGQRLATPAQIVRHRLMLASQPRPSNNVGQTDSVHHPRSGDPGWWHSDS